MSNDFIVKKSVHGTSFVSLQEQRNLYHLCFILHFALICITFALLKHVGHKYMGHGYVGNIQIALWVSSSSGSTGVTHFQP